MAIPMLARRRTLQPVEPAGPRPRPGGLQPVGPTVQATTVDPNDSQPKLDAYLAGQTGPITLDNKGIRDVVDARGVNDKLLEKKVQDYNYNYATGQVGNAEAADVNEYMRVSPMLQRKMLGSLNSRGLGSSVLAGGSGSGYLGELSNKQQSGLFGLKSGYQGLRDQLEQQHLAGNLDINSFYNALAQRKAYAQSLKDQQGDLFTDILGLAPAVGSLLL